MNSGRRIKTWIIYLHMIYPWVGNEVGRKMLLFLDSISLVTCILYVSAFFQELETNEMAASMPLLSVVQACWSWI